MQVKEISSSNLSLWVFFILAFAITTSSYGLRLLIRSQKFSSWLVKYELDIREHSEIGPDSPIRTTLLLKWMWHRFKDVFPTLLWVLITLLPLIPVWMSTLTRTMKSVISVVLILMVVFISVLYMYLVLGSVRPVRIMKRIAKKLYGNRHKRPQ